MSSKSYQRKSERFVVSNGHAPASPAQIKSCNWLLRSRSHSVEFGNDAIEILADSPTRNDADAIIKHLASCPNVRKSADVKPDPVKLADESVKRALALMAALDSGKLGKVAVKHAATIA